MTAGSMATEYQYQQQTSDKEGEVATRQLDRNLKKMKELTAELERARVDYANKILEKDTEMTIHVQKLLEVEAHNAALEEQNNTLQTDYSKAMVYIYI
jgi:hypothetical protein